jgi:ABC-2 type transport system ATP-binding protein
VIHVRNLTKYYGDYAAVRDVSFDVAKGRVVGFLGPNGAGKSTTMRVLAGYLTATSGQASIAGVDVFWRPVEVRRRIGYMPENCPLYPEMRVAEYLWYRGGLKGLHGGRCRTRVEYVLQRCWLTDVRRQLIGTLSKGYRQRVGLADVLLHNPPVLILDEPTSGLDPLGARWMKNLILDLRAQGKTVIMCSHRLEDVQDVCDRIAILSEGDLQAYGEVKTLLQDVNRVEMRGSGLQLTDQLRADLDDVLKRHGGKLDTVGHPTSTLEDYFLHIVEESKAHPGRRFLPGKDAPIPTQAPASTNIAENR